MQFFPPDVDPMRVFKKVLEMIYLIPTLITLIAAIPLATTINKLIRKAW